MQPRVELASQPMRVEAYLTPFSVLAELPRLGRAYSLSAYSLQICSPWFYSPGVAQAQEQRSALVRASAHEAELFFAQPGPHCGAANSPPARAATRHHFDFVLSVSLQNRCSCPCFLQEVLWCLLAACYSRSAGWRDPRLASQERPASFAWIRSGSWPYEHSARLARYLYSGNFAAVRPNLVPIELLQRRPTPCGRPSLVARQHV